MSNSDFFIDNHIFKKKNSFWLYKSISVGLIYINYFNNDLYYLLKNNSILIKSNNLLFQFNKFLNNDISNTLVNLKKISNLNNFDSFINFLKFDLNL
jgi:hypothetical protein